MMTLSDKCYTTYKKDINLYWFLYDGYEFWNGGYAPVIPNGCDNYKLKHVRFDKTCFGTPVITMLEFAQGDKKFELYTPEGVVAGTIDLNRTTNGGILSSIVSAVFMNSFFEIHYPYLKKFMEEDLCKAMQQYKNCYIVLGVDEIAHYNFMHSMDKLNDIR